MYQILTHSFRMLLQTVNVSSNPSFFYIFIALFLSFLFILLFKVIKISSTGTRCGEYGGSKHILYLLLVIKSLTRFDQWEDQLSKIIISLSRNISKFLIQFHSTFKNWWNSVESIIQVTSDSIHAPFENTAMIQLMIPSNILFFHSIDTFFSPSCNV